MAGHTTKTHSTKTTAQENRTHVMIVMCDMFFFARLIVDQSHTRAAERCSASGKTSEVRMPERVACQSAPAQAARLAWARRPRLRRRSLLPSPIGGPSSAGSGVMCLAKRSSREWSAAASSTASRKAPSLWARSWRHPVFQTLPSAKMSAIARAAHSAEDWRRHALFMAKPSKEPSRTARARVALARVWMQLLKLRKTATSQGCRYDVLCGGRKHSTT